MSDLQTREQMLAGIVKPADILDLLGKVDHVQYKTGWQSKHLAADAIREITRLRTALSEVEQRARREALGDAAQAIFTMGAWYPTFADKRIPCTFDEGTSAAYEIVRELEGQAERALIPSEPHDAEGRE